MSNTYTLEGLRFTEDEEIIQYFTRGQCNALAYELNRLKGYSLGICSSSAGGEDDFGAHAFCYTSDGLVIDIRGVQHFADFRMDWLYFPFVTRYTLSDYHKEMRFWKNDTHYTQDRFARKWAKIIVDILEDPFY